MPELSQVLDLTPPPFANLFLENQQCYSIFLAGMLAVRSNFFVEYCC